MPEAAAGGGAGSLGGSNRDGWGGGGRGDGDSNAGDGSEDKKKGGFVWQGWADRVAADPEFPFKVLLEQVWPTTACLTGALPTRRSPQVALL